MKKIGVLVIVLAVGCGISNANPFKKDYRTREIKYEYGVLKQDLQKERDSKLLNRYPTGYMTVEEYEKASEYKDKTNTQVSIPQIETPSDFKYVPKPIYKIVKYNNPAGSAELTLGRKLYAQRQINAQGVVSPDFSKLVYPAVYYYSDNAVVGADLFVIPFSDNNDTNLEKILKANVRNRITTPILSTDKNVNDRSAFRTLTPVDFSTDGKILFIKEKLGSSEDGIWETRIYTYDFEKQTSYDLNDLREAILYFWDEYLDVDLNAYRWDIMPLGFLEDDPQKVVVQGFAYTGERPVYLGAWAIDVYGEKAKMVSIDKSNTPKVSANGYKVVKDGVEEYGIASQEEKFLKQQSKVILKQSKAKDKRLVREIKQDYKYKLKNLNADYKDERRDNRKLQSLKGATEGSQIQQAFEQYQKDQLNKDIQKLQKQIDKEQKKLDKIDNKLQKLNQY